MQVAIARADPSAGTVAWQDPADGVWHETPVTGGACKLQWKADWAMRWIAFGVDYELFLDAEGRKVSKSKGNGLSVDEWLRYGPAESLCQFMYHAPSRAKPMAAADIPRWVDEHIGNVDRALSGKDAEVRANPAWHVLGGGVPSGAGCPVSYGMLLNLLRVSDATDPADV